MVDASRQVLNSLIRLATLDPATGNMEAVFLPNSQFTQLPGDYLHPNHGGYGARGQVVDITPFAPRRHGHGH